MTIKIKDGWVDLTQVPEDVLRAELKRRHPRGRPPIFYACQFCKGEFKSREFYGHLANCAQKPAELHGKRVKA
jgi:hypothetical protein